MEFHQALRVCDNAVYTQRRKRLSQAETIVLEIAWEDRNYNEASEGTTYTANYLKGVVAPQLWKVLRESLGNGEFIGKKRFRRFMEGLTLPANEQNLLAQAPPPPRPTRGRKPMKRGQPPDVIGGQPPDVRDFHGRGPELAMVKELITENRCVGIVGAPGIGKTALAAKIVQACSSSTLTGFKTIIWRSIQYAPAFENFVSELMRLLARTHKLEIESPETTEKSCSRLLEYLDCNRTLMILDAAEALLQGNRSMGVAAYGKYADYGIFLRRIIEEQRQSCLLFTSREPFRDILQLQELGQAARLLKIEGLGKDAFPILRDKQLADEDRWGELIQLYRGNPLALRMVGNGIQDYFDGSVATYLQHQTMLMSDLFQYALDQQFGPQGRLTSLERGIMIYLAEALSQGAESISFHQLLDDLKNRETLNGTTSQIMAAIAALDGRSMVEKSKNKTGEVCLSLQPVVYKYVSSRLLGLVSDTIPSEQSA